MQNMAGTGRAWPPWAVLTGQREAALWGSQVQLRIAWRLTQVDCQVTVFGLETATPNLAQHGFFIISGLSFIFQTNSAYEVITFPPLLLSTDVCTCLSDP